VDGDGAVTTADQTIIANLAGGKGTPIDDPAYRAEADLNRDGVIDGADATMAQTTVAALGAGVLSSSAVGNIVGYCGYLINDEIPGAGQYHVRHRVYDVALGRWITRDPAGFVDGMNLYEYVRSRVVLRVDPLGLDDYQIGYDDPYIPQDPGAGAHGAVSPTIEMQALKGALQGSLTAWDFIWPDAAAHMRHYLQSSGAPYTVRLRDMLDQVPSAQRLYDYELAQAKRFVQSLQEGEYDITSGKASPGYNSKSENQNWYFAVGGYRAWGKGFALVECDASNRRHYTLVFHYKIADRYNWDQGKSVNIGGITVTDAFMGDFHRMGLAQEFDMRGMVSQTYRWSDPHPVVPQAPQPIGPRRGR
jgi:RHS repeat-associated protein